MSLQAMLAHLESEKEREISRLTEEYAQRLEAENASHEAEMTRLSASLAEEGERLMREEQIRLQKEHDLKKKRLLLSKKRKLVDAILARLVDSLTSEPRRGELLWVLLDSIASGDGGTITPARGYGETIAALIRERGLWLELSSEDPSLDSGFLFRGAGYESNVSFSHIIHTVLAEDIEAYVHSHLMTHLSHARVW